MHLARYPDARILAVDDEEANLRLLRRVLERAGYTRVHTTTDPRELLGLCQPETADLLLLDLHMPGMDGLALISAVRAQGDGTCPPVLLLSGDPDPTLRSRALDGGATDFLAKPWEPAELQERVGALLEARLG